MSRTMNHLLMTSSTSHQVALRNTIQPTANYSIETDILMERERAFNLLFEPYRRIRIAFMKLEHADTLMNNLVGSRVPHINY